MRRWGVGARGGAVAGWVAVGLLVAGCAVQPESGTQVVPANSGLTPSAATHTSAQPAPGVAAATPGGPCPVPGMWRNRPAPTSFDGTPANTPEAEVLSQAVGTAGRQAAFRDVYGTQITDFPAGRVALCVTDLAAGHRLAEAAKRVDPRADLSRLDLYLARYSAARLSAAAQRLVPLMPKGVLGLPLYGVGGAADAGSLEVDTSAAGVKSDALRQRLEQLAGVPVTLVASGPAVGAAAVG